MTSRRHILENLRSSGRIVLLALAGLLLAAAANATGLAAAGDAVLRSQYYRVAGPRHDRQQVILVEGTAETTARWGPPPWSESRLRLLETSIARGGPVAIGRIAPARLSTSPTPRTTPEATADTPLRFATDTGVYPNGATVEALTISATDQKTLRKLAQRARWVVPESGTWPIHYLSPPTRLPRVAAHRVLSSEVPPSMFTGAVVLLGITSSTHVDAIATPVGDLTSAEIFAHALAAIANGQVWRVPSDVTLGVATLLMALFIAWYLLRRGPGRGLLVVGISAAACIAIDYVLFTESIALVGGTTFLFAMTGVSLSYMVATHRATHRVLHQFSRQISVSLERNPETRNVDSETFWTDLLDIAHAYVDNAATGVLAEVPAGAWHLEVRACHGIEADQLVERRQDIRRPPFRASYLTLRANFSKRKVVADPSLSTVVVPLAWKRRIYGMWLVNLPRSADTADVQLRALEETATHMAHAIADRRGDHESPALTESKRMGLEQLDSIRHAVGLVQENRIWAIKALHKLPSGILVADMWAKVRFVNKRMVRTIESQFPGGIPQNDLRALLARTVGGTLDDAHELMRMVLRTGVPVEVGPRTSPPATTPPPVRYVLRRLDLDARDDGGDLLPPLLLLVTQDERKEAQRMVWTAS